MPWASPPEGRVKTFAYRAYDRGGAARRGLIEAQDLKDARERLTARGLLPERVEPAEGGATSRDPVFGVETRVAFYRELGVLLGAGLPLTHTLEILMETPELGLSPRLLAEVRDRVREGASLASALGASAPRVKPFERAILEVGERSGSLEPMLDRLASFLEEQQRLHERIVSSLAYPAIILVFALVVAVVMLGFVVPSAAAVLMEQERIELPALTRFMMGVGRFLRVAAPAGLLAGWGGWLWLRRRLAADAGLRERLDTAWFRLPLIGRGYRIVVNLRCARTLAILLKGGVGLVEALPLAGRATGSAWVSRLMAAETDAVRHGSTLADAMRRIPPLAASLPAWIQAGEASGALERLLDTAGNAYQHQWNRFVTRAMGWLEPALIVLIGAFVLLVTLSVLLPVISLNRLLG
jgi:general secretion pathway protein F